MMLNKSLWLFASFWLTVSVVRGGIIFNPLYSFSGGTNGAGPRGPLVQGTDGLLYGVTAGGGAYITPTYGGDGTVFKVTTNGVFTQLHRFIGSDGRTPVDGLVQNKGDSFGGLFYGTTSGSGGSLYSIDTNGSLANQVWFSTDAKGMTPCARVIIAADGNIYGTTAQGGAYSKGTVFRVTYPGFNEVLLASFDGSNGRLPQSPLLLARDGNFYGTATEGGLNDFGTVFRVTPTGTFSNLLSFAGTNGAWPYAGLIQAADGYLYGTTQYGGLFSLGTVFRISTNGELATLVSFNGTNGASPNNGLIQGSDGNLYGVTTYGGTGFSDRLSGNGTIFTMTTNGTLTTLLFFNGTNGNRPRGELLESKDGNFYGTAGATIFKFNIQPPLPVFLSITPTNRSVVFSWQAVLGHNYQVQYNSHLNTTNWNNLGAAVTASTSIITTSDSNLSDSTRFYRILMLP
jgi:uncharacterized repeat protein (TIGR03803 family)